MDDNPSNSTANIALFIIQIISAASGFVIAASCLYLRKWHPPIAYTAAFHISFWIGVQAMITHSASAISVRLPDSSTNVQHSKPLVRFLVWAQFAMPLWFVFLNAAIATDLLLSQLLRVNVVKLQAVHKWYLPVATTMAFTLALPLLIYHSEYQPKANVFSVQFPSALSVTLYYILAFDIWIAIGIIYCFVIVSSVVSVIIIKLRKRRAAINSQNTNHIESAWSSYPPTADGKSALAMNPTSLKDLADRNKLANRAAKHMNDADKIEADNTSDEPCSDTNDDSCSKPNNVYIDPRQVSTFSRSQKPAGTLLNLRSMEQINRTGHNDCSNRSVPYVNPSDTLMSGITISDEAIAELESSSSSSHSSKEFEAQLRKDSEISQISPSSTRSGTGGSLQMSPATDQVRFMPTDSPAKDSQSIEIPSTNRVSIKDTVFRARRPLLRLASLPPQFTLRSSNRSTFTSSSSNSQFRIPTLALVRLLLYPLIPILSFTLMCVVRWVWFRSTMPSRWEVLNVVSGILRALEGFLCLIVFLLNPALNRSFREIRKRNTPVFDP
ncbi:hypothetical protein GGI15_004842 [Coemansia interrupta]|uniref:Uncharacterized protein n=1 Tax=Coemansia interrupta TaxID=1126814 RepID=A0A9W8H4G8_9FUNG|nr:hypothetical protein GGI15_004842 [Coemansia interrupta]